MSACSGSTDDASDGSTGAAGSAEQISVNLVIDGSEGGVGVIYDGTVAIDAGGSVYDALLASEVEMTVSSSLGMGAYVSSIGGLAEKTGSATSGWLYSVNGTRASVSCDAYELADGDEIQWDWRLDALSDS